MRALKLGRVSIAGLVIIGVLCVGVVLGVWLTVPATPSALQTAAPTTLVPVVARSYDDSRTVTLTVSTGKSQDIVAPMSGRVTALSCTPGGLVSSGHSALGIDGLRMLDLSLSVPPWRDLTVGLRGSDAAAMNAELSRLGYGVPVSDRITSTTIQAYAALARSAGVGLIDSGAIRLAQLIWLPAPEVRIASCPVLLGDMVSAGSPVFSLRAASTVKIESLPSDAIPGDRVVLVDGQPLPVETNGTMTDGTAVATLLTSASYASAGSDQTGVRQLSVQWQLATPTQVSVVAPAAVAGADGTKTCLIGKDGKRYPIRVVGSELGQTFVTAAGGSDGAATATLPTQVRTGVDNVSCGSG